MTTVDSPITEADRLRRVEVLSDLRVLLNYLESNPDVPVDRYAARIDYCVDGEGGDEAGFAEVRRAAEALGVRTVTSQAGHLTAELHFGNALYRIFYVPNKPPVEPAHCVCCTYDCGNRQGHVRSTRPEDVDAWMCNCGRDWPCELAS